MSATVPDVTTGRKVLVVDDEESVRDLINLYFTKEGFQVIDRKSVV